MFRKKNTAKSKAALAAAVVAMTVAGFSLSAQAETMAGSQSQYVDEKAIRVGDRERDTRSGDLEVSFEALRASYRVGEPIRFTARGNKTFYLYVYSVDKDTGDAVLILPNNKQSGNKYPGGRSMTVPNRNIEFYADEEGRERIVMVASTRYIDVGAAKAQPLGDFSKTKAAVLEGLFEEKGIKIRAPGDRADRGGDVVVKDVELRIRGRMARDRDDEDRENRDHDGDENAIVYVSTNRSRYHVGDRVRIVFGADKSGYVHLYSIEPGGSVAELTTRKVKRGETHDVEARAEAPGGDHKLVALYSKDGNADEDVVYDLAEDRYTKGLRLVTEDRGVLAVREFRIVR